MCEAEFPNEKSLERHIDLIHGGERTYRSAIFGFCELEPYVTSPTEKRSCIERFAMAQESATKPETEPYMTPAAEELQRKSFFLKSTRSFTTIW